MPQGEAAGAVAGGTAIAGQGKNLARPIGRYRWGICALLFFVITINYIDRQILALIKEFLDAELGWSTPLEILGLKMPTPEPGSRGAELKYLLAGSGNPAATPASGPTIT